MSGHTEQRRKAQIRKVVANARAIVTYQVGLPFSCVRMRRLLYRFEMHREYIRLRRKGSIQREA
jgi:hypothetical protein